MISVGQVLFVKSGCEAEYKRRHDELWPEMTAVMQKAGINMVVYLHENRLFLYATAPNQEAWDAVNNHSITPRWDKYMSEILECDENNQPIAKSLAQMFHFGNLI